MFTRIKKDFEEGIRKVKWFSSLLSERLRIEIAVFKLLYKAEEMKKHREELLQLIGEEVYSLRGQNKNIYARTEVINAIRKLDQLDPEIKENIEKASDISKILA